jgi:hypothetical protein
MAKDKKPLSPDQVAKLKAEFSIDKKPIPPWDKATNLNTTRDLRQYGIEQYLAALDLASKVEHSHAKELEEIRLLANAWRIGFNDGVVNNTRTGADKGRNQLETLYFEIELRVSELSNATGFDLLDRATWGDTP